MLRTIAGVFIGWVIMAIIVMATFIITMAVMGLEGILQPDSYWTTTTFNIIVLAGGLAGAIIGGLICKLIARNAHAAFALAAVVLAMGAGSFFMNMQKPDPPARIAAATLEDIGTHGKEPTWFALGKTIAGAVGVLLGASLVRSTTPRGTL